LTLLSKPLANHSRQSTASANEYFHEVFFEMLSPHFVRCGIHGLQFLEHGKIGSGTSQHSGQTQGCFGAGFQIQLFHHGN
ncbi:MAG TPA: hypothetical protein VGM92_00475, partial [Candidatus Kapabacteria bacterium]